MIADGDTPRPVVVGANHRSCPLSLRDRLFVEDPFVPGVLDQLKAAGLDQALVLSTCDRVEILTMHPDPAPAAQIAQALLAARAERAPEDLAGQIYTKIDQEAVAHMFSVAASLDSLVIGEPQVLGQVKACHRLARDHGMVGPALEALMQAAFTAAKKVRTETRIGEGPVSIAAAAAQTARDLHGDLSRCSALILGAGDMGELIGLSLLAAGLTRIRVAHPKPTRVAALAQALAAETVPFDTLAGSLAESDVVLVALNRPDYALTSDMVAAALKARRRKPMFLIDTGLPGDVEPSVDRLEEAFLYDLNDLETVAQQGRAGREDAAKAARALVDEEVLAYVKGRSERAAVPVLTALRDRFEAERLRALGDAGEDADRATRLLIRRLLHDPSILLREAAQNPDDLRQLEDLLHRLFRLDAEKE
ncbi:MAG: glutamyl-tRNA reductase [Magnetospiraceae bacterium]